MLQTFELMSQGKINGYICQGFNPLAAAPNKAKMNDNLAKLKFLVIMDPLVTETSEFWRNFGEHNDVDPKKIATEVFRLPTTCFAEEDGALVNSSRWLQWHWKGAEPPGEARSDLQIMSGLFTRLRALYMSEGGAYPEPIVNLSWPYAVPESPSPDELAKEYSGRALKELTDPKNPSQVTRKAGEQLAGFAELRDDGSTLSGCWIYCGAWGPNGNLMARRDNSDPTGIGQTLNWSFAWPANRRVMYNRASCDASGKPFNPQRKLIAWNGTAWGGPDIPDYKADEDPSLGMGPFIMNADGVGRFFARGGMAEGPFPEHYEPFETPLASNPLSPGKTETLNNPAARVFKDDRAAFGKVEQFPHVATTYRLTEHFHFWTQHSRLNAVVQPQQFVEIGEALAKEIGIAGGDPVKVSSNRGYIKAVAVVTKRLRTLTVDGKPVHTGGVEWTIKDGIPYHGPTLMRDVKAIVAKARTDRSQKADKATVPRSTPR